MIKNDISVKYSNILILGFTFKENCPDVRNTRVIDIVKVLSGFEAHCEIYDPWADPAEVKQEYGVDTVKDIHELRGKYDAIVIAVGHREFLELNYSVLKKNDLSVIYDIKGILEKDLVSGRL
jgi:UDP-N-acetyl-D-galactosamine dehydrogenase